MTTAARILGLMSMAFRCMYIEFDVYGVMLHLGNLSLMSMTLRYMYIKFDVFNVTLYVAWVAQHFFVG